MSHTAFPLPLNIPYSFLEEAAEKTYNSLSCRFVDASCLQKIKRLPWELYRFIIEINS